MKNYKLCAIALSHFTEKIKIHMFEKSFTYMKIFKTDGNIDFGWQFILLDMSPSFNLSEEALVIKHLLKILRRPINYGEF